MNSVDFSSNRIYSSLVLLEIVRRSIVEDTSSNYSTFSGIPAIPSLCVLVSYLEPSTVYHILNLASDERSVCKMTNDAGWLRTSGPFNFFRDSRSYTDWHQERL